MRKPSSDTRAGRILYQNGNPLQYSGLENPVDRRAWQTTIHEVERESHTTGCLTFDVQTACPLCCKLVYSRGFPSGSEGKESACIVGGIGSIPGLGRSPGGGHGNPLQYSCLENPRGQRSLVGCSPWGHKESDMTKHTHIT